VIIVGIESLEVESGLFAGEFVCPDCSGVLRPWGSARRRFLRCAGGEVWRRPRSGLGTTEKGYELCNQFY